MERKDTFSQKAKTELLHVSVKNDGDAGCELASLFLCAGRPDIKEEQMPYYYFSRRRELIDRIMHLIQKCGGKSFAEATRSEASTGWKCIPLPTDSFSLPSLLKSFLTEEVQDQVTSGESLRRSALRGAFLACGSISDPEKEYRIELSAKNPEVRRYLILLLHSENIVPLLSKRKNRTILYIKDVESILNFLALTGAHTVFLRLESKRVDKNVHGHVHRIVNCDSANTRRQAEAGARQIQWLERLLMNPSATFLPDDLLETARVRVDNPGLSLQEAGKMLSVSVSKSGMNHRIKKLEKIAEDLGVLEKR